MSMCVFWDSLCFSANQTFLLGCIRVQETWLMNKGQRRDDVMAHVAFTCELSLAVYSSMSVWLMHWGTAIPVIQHYSLTLTSPYVSLFFLPDLIRSTFVLSSCLWSRKWTLHQWPCEENKRMLGQTNFILTQSSLMSGYQLRSVSTYFHSTHYVPSSVSVFLPSMAILSLNFSSTNSHQINL